MQKKNTPRMTMFTPRRIAFNQAYELFGDQFFRYFYSRTRDLMTTEDLCQNFWLSVYKRIPDGKLLEIRLLQKRANEVFADYIRRKNTRAFVEFHADVPDAAGTVSTESATEADEIAFQARFWELMPDAKLTPQQRKVFWMNKRLGYTVAEISHQTSIPPATVHDWIQRALDECRKSLNKET